MGSVMSGIDEQDVPQQNVVLNLDVMSFEQLESIIRTTKSEAQAKACRDAIERVFTEREEFRKRIETLEAEAKNPKPVIFNIDQPETRNAIMAALTPMAPAIGCGFPQPEVRLQSDGGKIVARTVYLEGYGEMSPDDAEGLCFQLYSMTVRARAS